MAGVESGVFARFFRETYCPVLLMPVTKAIVVAGFTALLGVCMWGASNLSVQVRARTKSTSRAETGVGLRLGSLSA